MTSEITSGNRVIRMGTDYAPILDEVRRSFDSYFNSVVPQRENGCLVADFSKVAIHRHTFNNLEFMTPGTPEDAETLAAYFDRNYLPASRKLAFDVGAYCGVTTYEMAMRFERVVAFEPDPMNHSCLWSNVNLHELDNVTVVPAAMAAVTGKATFYAEGTQGSRLALPEYTRGPLMPVDTVSLTDACSRYGTPDFIKIDIEGAEVEVLESARSLLTKERIAIVLDTDHLLNKQRKTGNGDVFTVGRVEELLRSCGYEVETTMPSGCYMTRGWKP